MCDHSGPIARNWVLARCLAVWRSRWRLLPVQWMCSLWNPCCRYRVGSIGSFWQTMHWSIWFVWNNPVNKTWHVVVLRGWSARHWWGQDSSGPRHPPLPFFWSWEGARPETSWSDSRRVRKGSSHVRCQKANWSLNETKSWWNLQGASRIGWGMEEGWPDEYLARISGSRFGQGSPNFCGSQNVRSQTILWFEIIRNMPHRANSSLQDIFVRKLVKRIKEKVSENDMWVDGQFMSEKDMRDDGIEEQPSCTRPFQTAPQSLI